MARRTKIGGDLSHAAVPAAGSHPTLQSHLLLSATDPSLLSAFSSPPRIDKSYGSSRELYRGLDLGLGARGHVATSARRQLP